MTNTNDTMPPAFGFYYLLQKFDIDHKMLRPLNKLKTFSRHRGGESGGGRRKKIMVDDQQVLEKASEW